MRALCISDVHGNLLALTAVLATAERRSFSKLLVAGDIVFPGGTEDGSTQPLETWRRLSAAGAMMVQGVTDQALATLDPDRIDATTDHEKRMIERMKRVRGELGDIVLERLRRLPKTFRMNLEDGGELVLVHGSPADPSEAITFDMSDEEVLALLGDDPADVVVCGMSHVPFDRMVSDVRIIGVGSVGEAPDGVSPRDLPMVAHATWIESSPSGVVVEQIVVPLDLAPTQKTA
jgi:predicted phosphodiesterase